MSRREGSFEVNKHMRVKTSFPRSQISSRTRRDLQYMKAVHAEGKGFIRETGKECVEDVRNG